MGKERLNVGQLRGFYWTVARALVALALASCSGGQSGTDGDSPMCLLDEGAAVELDQPWLGLTVGEHVALLNTEWSVDDGTGSLETIPVKLSVDAEAAVHHQSVGEDCTPSEGSVSLAATIHVTVGEAFDFGASGSLLTLTTDGASLFADFCWDSEAQTASLMGESCPGDLTHGRLTLHLDYQPEFFGVGSYRLNQLWIDWAPQSSDFDWDIYQQVPVYDTPERHRPLPEVEDVCTEQESVEAGSFDTEADARAAVTGTWALCDAEHSSPFAGVEISSNDTWKAIVGEAGTLSVSHGFEREGTIRWWDTSEQNERPGYFQLDLVGPHWWFPAGSIHLSASGNTLDLSSTKLVRIDQAVESEPAPDAKAGDRLGDAGCTSGETDMQDLGTSAADVNRNLAGEYVGCAGLSGSLRFDAAGNVTLLGADGEELQTVSFTVVQTLSDTAQLWVDDETWSPVLSSRPVKLWIRRTRKSVPPEELETWVLSARPE